MRPHDNTPEESAATHAASITDIDYEREARIIRDIIRSEQVGVNVKDFFRFYLADLLLFTGVVTMGEALGDVPHLDPELLPLIYPEMRRRDKSGYGATALIHAALNGFTGHRDNREADAISAILEGARGDAGEGQGKGARP